MAYPGIRKRITRLSGILRVADGLDRSHYQNVQVRVERDTKTCTIYIQTIANQVLRFGEQ